MPYSATSKSADSLLVKDTSNLSDLTLLDRPAPLLGRLRYFIYFLSSGMYIHV